MPVLVKVCWTGSTYGPKDGASIKRQTVYPDRRLVRQQLTQGSFGLFSLCLNLKICRFDLKSSYFSQFNPRNITRTYLSQNHKSKVKKLETVEEKKLKNLSSRTPQAPLVPASKLKYFSMDFITRYVGFH